MKNNIFNLRALLISCFLLAGLSAFAQISVRGTVIDAANDEPIIGASILEIGTTNGTVTDFDGNFVMTVTSADSKIVVSSVGMESKELKVSTSPMKIVLSTHGKMLQDVVVTGMSKVD